ncbi:unnamed protein product [Lactuca saligna]|uniref:SHSP domain-containing protein n=1 Tax=Lactuca saligna TaxID=75948 RepID=A0AA35ZFC5_LACSI|nr:unnamed protein product [Lactuca saligna]
MALNIDKKLMKVADEFADFDLLKTKDQPGPHFRTQETESMFILSVQLQGYKRTHIKVERNKDGNITIHGEKPFQDTLMVGGKVIKKDIEMHGFRMPFIIPQGVVLDKVKARFNEDNSELVIRIPKATKGFIGIGIEELKTKEIPSESTELLHIYSNGELSEQEIEEKNVQDFTENIKDEQVETNDGENKEHDNQEPKLPQRKFKICTPVMFGSTFFVSLIVLVFHLVQSKKPVKQQKKTDED